MQVSVEKTSELSRKMTVSVPVSVFQEKIAARLKALAREVKVDGFRPGKVPQHVIKKMYGERVGNEIAGDLIKTTYFEALKEQDLRPVDNPSIHSMTEDESFTYAAEFEVYPEIPLEGIGQIEVLRPVATVQDSDIDNIVEKLMEQNKRWAVVERASLAQDRLTISFSGVCGGENFTNGKVENYQVVCGGGQMIPGFEDNLIGLEPGAKKTFVLSFPDDYGKEKLAGKAAEFEVEVLTVEEPVLPELDDAFARSFGIDGSVSDLRESIMANLEAQLKQALQGKLKNAVLNALDEKFLIAVPNVLVEREVENLCKPYVDAANSQVMKPEDMALLEGQIEGLARRRVKLGLVCREVILINDIQPNEALVRSTVENIANNYERPQEVIKLYFSDENRLNDVRQMVLENQAVDWIISRAKVTDMAISFSDAVNKQAQEV